MPIPRAPPRHLKAQGETQILVVILKFLAPPHLGNLHPAVGDIVSDEAVFA